MLYVSIYLSNDMKAQIKLFTTSRIANNSRRDRDLEK